jgi:hypothetical protein
MYVLGPVILLLVGGWYAFSAVDSMGLSSTEGSALVTGKEHRPAGRTYTTTVINNRTMTVPHDTPEAFVLTLAVAGDTTQGAADRDLYEHIQVGDRVRVTYARRRVTGGVQVVKVSR